MIKEAIGTGATVEEASQNAVEALNAGENEEVQIDVISLPKKKVLGMFGGCEAQVRAFVELPDEKPQKKAEHKSKKAPKKAQAKLEPTAKIEAANTASVEEDYKDAVDAATLDADCPAARAVKYLTDILTKFGCQDITAKVSQKENGAYIILDGEGLGVVIGRRGETLDALQYLAGLAANNGGGYYKVSLNIGSYREKREQTLIALATRVAAQVKSTGRSRALEPMNPYERRIIHTAVQGIDGVISGSVGEGSSRRVVITVEGGEIRAPKNERRGRSNYGRRGSQERKPSSTVNAAPTREPKKDSDIPLYGKIN